MEQILTKLDQILALLQKPQEPERGLLYAALAKAQGSFKKLIPDEENALGKYASLQSILTATRESLANNNLAIYHKIILLDEGSGATIIKTILAHESGQTDDSTARVILGKTTRATNNLIEDIKRTHTANLLGIAPVPNYFDDSGGEEEEEKIVEEIIRPSKKTVDPNSVITKDRYLDLLRELEGYEQVAESIMQTYKIETLADLPNEVYHDALAKIRRIKRTAEDYERRKK